MVTHEGCCRSSHLFRWLIDDESEGHGEAVNNNDERHDEDVVLSVCEAYGPDSLNKNMRICGENATEGCVIPPL